MSVALITGGATGIGRGFANMLADQGYDLIITSRNLDNLAKAQKEIQDKYKRKVNIFIADITDEEAREKLYDYALNYDVSVVVNNAGIGLSKDFLDTSLEEEMAIIDLNIIAFQAIFKHFYRKFRENASGRIINISSVAGFLPGPHASTYYASKAYATSITRAVAYESRNIKDLRIQCVCPGATRSNFFKHAGTKEKAYRYDPDKLALGALKSKRVVYSPGFKAKMTHVIGKLFPTKLVMFFASRRLKRIRDK